MIGQTISHYKITTKIGEGGMGEVYRATDTKLNRDVALKVLPDAFAADRKRMARFSREAQVLASLNHPNIASIYGLEDSEDKQALVLELVEGETLAERIKGGAIPLEESLKIALQIAEALEAAHKQNIVHRDLKPANIMLTLEGHVKVMDFGLAKRLVPTEGVANHDETVSSTLTATGATLGTLPYMSPEQVRAQEVDSRSDIFSFGVLLYEMLTGIDPFKKAQSEDTSSSIVTEDPPPLSRYMNEVPPVLQHTVRKMLAKDPDRRYQLLHEVRTDLGELMDEIGDSRLPTEEAVTGPSQVRAEVAERSWRQLAPWGVASLMTVALLISPVVPRHAVRSVEPTTPLRLYVQLPRDQSLNTTNGGAAILSPDGKRIAVEDGKFRISRDGGQEPSWGPQGRELVYLENDDQTMMVVPIQTEPTFRAGTPEALFKGPQGPQDNIGGGRRYDISPDGQRFLMIKDAEQRAETGTELIIVLNWFEELKRLVPTEK